VTVRSSAPNLPAPSSLPPSTAALQKDGICQRPWVLLFGLGGAVLVRVAVAGSAGVGSVSAGFVFGALVLGLAVLPVLAGVRGALAPGPVRAQLVIGLAGAAVLCVVPLAVHLRTPGGALPLSQLPVWAAVVTLVAVAEEVLLRGVLWSAAEKWRGTVAALVMTTGAFGLLHVPLYGWEALPLDLAVGLLLGGLRMAAGGWGSAAVAHTVADLAGWWLR
jgi:membrane protease YdiL (CAAX protease family)